MFFPIILIVIGGVFLLKNLGYISLGAWSIIWPVLLILFGAYILWKRHKIIIWRDRVWRKLE